jgi:hypothetical protein
MIKLLAVLTAGTVISLMTVPFLFSQDIIEIPAISLSKHHSISPFSFANKLKYDSTIQLSSDTGVVKKSVKKEFRMKKSPLLAVLLSAVLPGAGQFYNESYWKVPIFIGLTVYLGYEYYDNNKTYRNYRDQYEASQNLYPPYGDLSLLSLREFYRNQRDDFFWYFIIVYVLNMVDAYIDAHLFDFNVSEDKIEGLGLNDKKYNLNFKINF